MAAIVTGGYGSNENEIVTFGLGGPAAVSTTLRGFASQPQNATGQLSDNSMSAVGDQGQSAYGNIIGNDSIRRGGGNRSMDAFVARPHRYLPLSGSAEQESDADGRIYVAASLSSEAKQGSNHDGVTTAVLLVGSSAEQPSTSLGWIHMSSTVGAYAMAEQAAYSQSTLVVSEDDEAVALLLLV